MPDLGSAYVNIIPKAPGIEGKIEGLLSDGSGGAEHAGESLGSKLMGGIAKIGIGAAVVKTVKDAFEAGGNLQQSFGGLDTIYGDASAAAKDYAMAAAQAGISANTYAEQAVSFGASLKQAFGGDTAKAAEAANTAIMDMADNAAKMGTPIESLQTAYQGFAKQNYTMLDNLKLGYGGTQAEMERLLADAQKLSGVEYDISNLGDVYSAIHVIQGELGLTGVAADEASTTLTGSFSAMKASWENVLAALTTGEGLETAMANMGVSVNAFATNVVDMFSTLIPQIPTLVGGLAQTFIKNSPQLIKSGIEMLIQLGVGLITGIPLLIQQIPEIFAAAEEAFAAVDWAGIGGDIIAGIVQGLRAWGGSIISEMSNMAKSAWQSAKNFLGIGSPSKVFAQEVGRWIPAGMAEGINDNLSPVDTAIGGMASTAVSDLDRAAAAPAAMGAGSGSTAEILGQLLQALQDMKYDFYLDGRQITDAVTIRQKRDKRAGVLA